MTRLRKILAAAAALVATGLTLNLALDQASTDNGQPVKRTCKQIARAFGHPETFYLLADAAVGLPPEAIGQRVIGACAQGVCDVCGSTWTYKLRAKLNGQRVFRVHAPKYIGGSLKLWVRQTAGVKWLGSAADTMTACSTVHTGGECVKLLGRDKQSWLLDTGAVCHHGKLYDKGIGGDQPCPYARVLAPMDSSTDRGAGGAVRAAARQYTDKDLDL